MAPANLPGPNSVSTDENISLRRKMPPMVFESPGNKVNSLVVTDSEHRQSIDSDVFNNSSLTPRSPQTPTLTTLKTFRFCHTAIL